MKLRASDIHLMEGHPPYIRVDGHIAPVKSEPFTHDQIMDILKEILTDGMREKLKKSRGVDVGLEFKEMCRCRAIVFYERKHIKIVMRLVPLKVPGIEDLELPETLKRIAEYPRGLVVVTSPTGSGKSTTLAAMVDHLNATRRLSIITIEDPIEFVHTNKKSLVCQREVGEDIENFYDGVLQSMRQDPDVLMIGELRDMETMRAAIKAAETGHLVLGTLHTVNAVQTIERIISSFPDTEQELIRELLTSNLKAVISQNLIVRKVGKGRIAAVEIMAVTDSIQKLIAENRLTDIYSIMRAGKEGMQTFDQHLAQLAREERITREEGERRSRDVYAFKRYLQGILSSSDQGGIIDGFS